MADVKALLKIDYRCNYHCYFCWKDRNMIGQETGNIFKSTEEAKKIIHNAKNSDIDTVVFSGGEPTIRKDIKDLSAFTESLGLNTGVATNLSMFQYEELLDDLMDRGLNWIYGTFYSKYPDTFKKITRTSNIKFNKKGIKNCISKDVELLINHVITKHNINELEDNVEYLVDKDAKTLKLSMVEPVGLVENNIGIVPDIEKTAEKINLCIDRFGDEIDIYFEGIPLCLSDHKNNFREFKKFNIKYMCEPYENKFYRTDTKYSRINMCEGCELDNCPGIYRNFYKKFKEKSEKIVRQNKVERN